MTNREVALKILASRVIENAEIPYVATAIEAVLNAKDARIKKLEDALREYQLFHIHIETQIEIYKTQKSMSDAMALVPIKRMFKMVDERAREALGE